MLEYPTAQGQMRGGHRRHDPGDLGVEEGGGAEKKNAGKSHRKNVNQAQQSWKKLFKSTSR